MNESSRLRETLRRESKMACRHRTKSPSSWAPWVASWTSLAQSKPSAEKKICLRAIVPISQSKIAKEEYDETLCKH